ncbi:transient receptor potential cation channel protein painless-like [Neocloeon triangulifer]|uniref:transient receptor potential cation channel protein painless-like n=1 Tax=Neocloeon triangulifer TaxID=2078957 RepID=UPI00286F6804|nr:transient receptor potential cation channel protein painless-like [Neocloeon triangulifer]
MREEKSLHKLLMDRPAKSITELTERTLNLYWASRTGNHKLALTLLKRGADPLVCHPDSGEGPLHAAAYHGHFKVVEALLENGSGPNFKTAFPAEETAMHIILRNGSPSKSLWTKAREEKCFRSLLAAPNFNVDICDGSGMTLVHLAAKLGLWNFVEMLLEHQPNLDIHIEGETARDLILTNSGREWTNLPRRKSVSQIITEQQLLLNYLRDKNEKDFIELLQHLVGGRMSKVDLQICLKTACSYGCLNAVQNLLHFGADPNDFVYEPPVIIAAKLGHANLLETLLETKKVVLNRCDHPLWQRGPLHLAVISAATSSNPDFTRCIQLLLDKKYGLDVNSVDFRGNTALHYAAKSTRQDLARLILQTGCNIFVCNQHGEPGFLNVSINDVQNYMDGFIAQRGFTEKNHSLELDYQFLKQKETQSLEMQPMLLLSRSKVHRVLLKHPLITSFLHLKWQKLKWFFYLKFLAYFLFTVSLSLHIYHYVQFIPSSPDSPYRLAANSRHNYVRWISVLLLAIFIFGEVLEASVSIKKYLNSYENCLKMVLIALSMVLLFTEINHYAHQVISTATIICAYTELALLIGTHPRFATYINMFLRVSRNFIGFFFLFSFLIFAFAFSFFVLFHDCENKEENCKFFTTLGGSIFKTVIMLSGEMEAENLETNLFGYILFLVFVLFVPICLLNLMTGLAVSDIAAIREEAEIGLVAAKVELYANIESVLLGRTFRGLRCNPLLCCLNCDCFMERKIRLLGYSLSDNKLVWFLDLDNKMEPDSNEITWFSKIVPASLKKYRRMEWLAIVEEAQNIVLARNNSEQEISAIAALERKIDDMNKLLKELAETVKN